VRTFCLNLKRRETRTIRHVLLRGLVDNLRGTLAFTTTPPRRGFVVLNAEFLPFSWNSASFRTPQDVESPRPRVARESGDRM